MEFQGNNKENGDYESEIDSLITDLEEAVEGSARETAEIVSEKDDFIDSRFEKSPEIEPFESFDNIDPPLTGVENLVEMEKVEVNVPDANVEEKSNNIVDDDKKVEKNLNTEEVIENKKSFDMPQGIENGLKKTLSNVLTTDNIDNSTDLENEGYQQKKENSSHLFPETVVADNNFEIQIDDNFTPNLESPMDGSRDNDIFLGYPLKEIDVKEVGKSFEVNEKNVSEGYTSLENLLKSLKNTNFDFLLLSTNSELKIDLDIFIDDDRKRKSQYTLDSFSDREKTIKTALNFRWKYGKKKIHARKKYVGRSLQIFESWKPNFNINNSQKFVEDVAIFLNDDIVFSEFWLEILVNILNRNFFSPNSTGSRKEYFGVSLRGYQGCLFKKVNKKVDVDLNKIDICEKILNNTFDLLNEKNFLRKKEQTTVDTYKYQLVDVFAQVFFSENWNNFLLYSENVKNMTFSERFNVKKNCELNAAENNSNMYFNEFNLNWWCYFLDFSKQMNVFNLYLNEVDSTGAAVTLAKRNITINSDIGNFSSIGDWPNFNIEKKLVSTVINYSMPEIEINLNFEPSLLSSFSVQKFNAFANSSIGPDSDSLLNKVLARCSLYVEDLNIKFVIIFYVNKNQLLMVSNFLCHLKNINLHQNRLFIAADLIIYNFLMNIGEEVIFVDSGHNNGNLENKQIEYGKKGFLNLMLDRTSTVSSILEKNYSVLLADTDMIWSEDPRSYLFGKIRKGYDVIGQIDPVQNHRSLCGGFLFLKSSEKVVKFWNGILSEFKIALRNNIFNKNEQSILNSKVHQRDEIDGGIKIFYLPVEKFPSGKNFFKKKITNTWPITIHNNFIRGIDKKIARFKLHNMWGLNDFTSNGLNCKENFSNDANLTITSYKLILKIFGTMKGLKNLERLLISIKNSNLKNIDQNVLELKYPIIDLDIIVEGTKDDVMMNNSDLDFLNSFMWEKGTKKLIFKYTDNVDYDSNLSFINSWNPKTDGNEEEIAIFLNENIMFSKFWLNFLHLQIQNYFNNERKFNKNFDQLFGISLGGYKGCLFESTEKKVANNEEHCFNKLNGILSNYNFLKNKDGDVTNLEKFKVKEEVTFFKYQALDFEAQLIFAKPWIKFKKYFKYKKFDKKMKFSNLKTNSFCNEESPLSTHLQKINFWWCYFISFVANDGLYNLFYHFNNYNLLLNKYLFKDDELSKNKVPNAAGLKFFAHKNFSLLQDDNYFKKIINETNFRFNFSDICLLDFHLNAVSFNGNLKNRKYGFYS
ncbi:hypothetical protein HK099_005804 [Clydaea vesicula]|uniref:Nucleotide-diphospho-sugar transferase domain-containing protein n=1 Tax=Clydaea vesicula TaxID=447962 RepID=A0AAD5U6E2_9FUNG|nr:hypothetical protein HK099_005804 [Clydaea vesicula]